jgi:hypothetical protein
MRFGTFFFEAPPGHHHAIRVGLAAAILPFHHPLRLAEQMALIDIHRRRPPARHEDPLRHRLRHRGRR